MGLTLVIKQKFFNIYISGMAIYKSITFRMRIDLRDAKPKKWKNKKLSKTGVTYLSNFVTP